MDTSYAAYGIFFLVIYAAAIALSLWITYLIIRTAVKNGMIRAWEHRARNGMIR